MMEDILARAGGMLTLNTFLFMAVASLGGLVRGFSGFGVALVVVPLSSTLVDPKIAVVTVWMVNAVVGAPLTVEGMRRCNWSEVRPLSVGILICTPIGAWILAHAPIDTLRWIIALLVLVSVIALGVGWRRTQPVARPGLLGIGGVSGLAGGIAGFYGPPVVLFWVGGPDDKHRVRNNLNGVFAVTTIAGGASFWLHDLITLDKALLALLAGPAYGVGVWLGARLFPLASERVFRRAALALCGISALSAMPVW
ncbi:MAG: sulfite exporter TauE/SafE family protein [Pseudomonadota bacterium]|nr:sulfite exporter TauE/SafE family protein [Pseudomonadota bacterium]